MIKLDTFLDKINDIQTTGEPSPFLLDDDSEPRFIIDSDKRSIIVPSEFQFIGVKTDQRAEKIYFEIDRIFDDVDLSSKVCVVQFINVSTSSGKNTAEGIFPVTEYDVDTEPGKIIFKWEVDNVACRYAGVLSFAVRFYDIDPETSGYSYCWNTTPATIKVLDTLDVISTVPENYPTELLEWNYRMMELNNRIEQSIKLNSTFIPSVSPDGTLTWTNTGGLPNPDPVNLMGPKPVAGVDYFTDEEKSEMVQEVLNALPMLDGVSY